MQVICSYCNKDLGEKEPLGNKKISHGACKQCAQKELAEIMERPSSSGKIKAKKE